MFFFTYYGFNSEIIARLYGGKSLQKMTEASFYYFFIELKSYGIFIDFKHAVLDR